MYYIGYDIGSSSIKAALVEASTGKSLITVNEPSQEMEIIALQKDWAEQDPELWWHYVCKATHKILSSTGIDAKFIASIGISYQMHGLVVVDKYQKALRNAIIWCDSRAVDIGHRAFEDLGQDKCRTHLLNSPGNFTASKLKWVLDHEPEVYEKIDKYMLPGDFIAMKFSGEINTTKNGLSEGILWDYKQENVAHWLLEYYGIDTSLTPELVDNFTAQSYVSEVGAKESGLPIGIPITYRSGDQPNNALSLNVFNNGEVAATGGTSGVVYAVSDHIEPKEIKKINQFAHVNYTNDQPKIGKLLNINGAGIMYRWLKNQYGIASYQIMNDMADKVPIGANGLSVLPFGNGAERMFDNKTLDAQFNNINFNVHGQGHLCRAALEGIAFSFVYGIELMKNDHTTINVIRAGNDNLFRSEIFSNTIASLIGHSIEIYDTTGAVGAARASGLVDGNFDKFGQQITTHNHIMNYEPVEDNSSYLEAYYHWKTILTKRITNI